jgi:glutamate-1-semialdehyde 2,1-aminomutase
VHEARVTDVDGHKYLDFCLGDTGSMFGHSPKAVVDAVREQVGKGITLMLPTRDSIWVGEELGQRFGLPYWQIVMTATDANRYCIRLARMATRRKKILVMNGCYHGSVDEALVSLEKGKVVPRSGNIGAPVDPSLTTKVVEFNDVKALAKALRREDVACVLAEPAMTNHGIILPDKGYHDELRKLTQKHGTLLVIDETHTLWVNGAEKVHIHEAGWTPNYIGFYNFSTPTIDFWNIFVANFTSVEPTWAASGSEESLIVTAVHIRRNNLPAKIMAMGL